MAKAATPAKPENKTTSEPVTKEQIEKERASRVQACRDSIVQTLQRYDCDLNATPVFTEQGTVSANIQVVSKR